MRCPHCGNDDPTLIEMICIVVGSRPTRVSRESHYLCVVCSRTWPVFEPHAADLLSLQD